MNAARVWRPRSLATLRNHLGQESLDVWADGDVLEVLWRGEADTVKLSGTIQQCTVHLFSGPGQRPVGAV